jgi:hypothetical protein
MAPASGNTVQNKLCNISGKTGPENETMIKAIFRPTVNLTRSEWSVQRISITESQLINEKPLIYMDNSSYSVRFDNPPCAADHSRSTGTGNRLLAYLETFA